MATSMQEKANNKKYKIFFYFFMKIVGILFTVMMTVTIFLDYAVFVDIFHFNSSTFLDIYLHSVNMSSTLLLLGTVIFPLFFVLLIFSVSYLITFIPIKLSEPCDSEKNYENKISICRYTNFIGKTILKQNILRLCFYHLILMILFVSIFILVLPMLNDVIYQILSLLLIVILVNLFITPLIIDFEKQNKFFMYKYMLILLIFYTVGIVFTSSCNLSYGKLVYILFMFNMLILTFLSILMTKQEDSEYSESNIFLFLSIIVVYLSIITYFAYDENNNTWKLDKNESTYSLYMNKLFQSENTDYIDINISYFNRSMGKLEDVNKKYLSKIIKNNILCFKKAKYLPLSNENKLYFMDTEDNTTLVFALKRNSNKEKDNYRLIDIGYFIQEKNDTKKIKTIPCKTLSGSNPAETVTHTYRQ